MNEVGSDITNLSNSSLGSGIGGDNNLNKPVFADGIQNGKGNSLSKSITEPLKFVTNANVVPPNEKFSAGNYLPKFSTGISVGKGN